MSLSRKMAVVLLLALVGLTVASLLLYRYIVYQSYLELEQRQETQELSRAVQALQREVDYLDTFLSDWSSWDDSFQYIKDHNRRFADSNIQDSTFLENQLNLMAFIDMDE